MPTDWVTKQQSSLLSPQQIVALETKVTSRFNLNIGKLPGMGRNVWWPISCRRAAITSNKYIHPPRTKLDHPTTKTGMQAERASRVWVTLFGATTT
jgi:hypothetical protein